MSETLPNFKIRVNNLHNAPYSEDGSEDQKLTGSQLSQAINDALETYSSEFPQEYSVDITANNTGLYTMTELVADWDDRYEILGLSLETDGNRKPLDEKDWSLFQDEGIWKLKILSRAYGYPEYEDLVAVSSPITVLEYSYPHAIHESDAAQTTVRLRDLSPLAYLAASLCCLMMAAKAADVKSSSSRASTVNYAAIFDKWNTMADKFEAKWNKHMGKHSDGGGGFGEYDLDGPNGFPFSHGRRWH